MRTQTPHTHAGMERVIPCARTLATTRTQTHTAPRHRARQVAHASIRSVKTPPHSSHLRDVIIFCRASALECSRSRIYAVQLASPKFAPTSGAARVDPHSPVTCSCGVKSQRGRVAATTRRDALHRILMLCGKTLGNHFHVLGGNCKYVVRRHNVGPTDGPSFTRGEKCAPLVAP